MCLHMYVCTYTNVYVYIHMKEKANVTKFNNLIGVSRCWRYDVHFSIIATFLRFKAFQNEKMGRKYRKSSFLQMIKKEKRKEEARRNFLILAKQLFLMLREQNGSRAASRLGGDTIRTDKRWWWLGSVSGYQREMVRNGQI